MAFLFPYRNKNFVTSFVHVFLNLQVENGLMCAFVRSFVDMEAYEAGVHNWHDHHPIPIANFADPEAWLISPEGPFAGGDLLPEAGSFARVKALRWAQIKAERYRRTTSGFTALGVRFDSDAEAVANITAKANHALAAKADGIPFETVWTLADNSSFPMDADQMIAVSVALSAHGESIFAIARDLRAQIESVDPESPTAESSVLSVSWPTTIPNP